MKLINILLQVILIVVILFLVTRTFKKADERKYASAAMFSRGNAPDSIRKPVIEQLHKFQDGYSRRDMNRLDSFMHALYAKDNILILGTMPGEIFAGYDKAARLVKSDWESWGDCRFAVDNANISSNGNTAWFSVEGYVKFDLSRLLVIPLRFTGVMVNDHGTWKFQQQQFQFDVDFSFSIVATLLLFIWLVATLIMLFVVIVKKIRQRPVSNS